MDSAYSFNPNDMIRINRLAGKMRHRTATSEEMREFLDLIQNSGQDDWIELQNYVRVAGYSSVEDFREHLGDRTRKEVVDGLVKIGTAILVAYSLTKLFRNKQGNLHS